MRNTINPSDMFYPVLAQEVKEILQTVDQIEDERKKALNEAAHLLSGLYGVEQKLVLNFICTHNSRRSQLSESWAYVASNYFQLNKIHAVSGGTEATAFNERAVLALQKCGFLITKATESSNPFYLVQAGPDIPVQKQYSKRYDDALGHGEKFVAIMTCDHADHNCPYIPEALARISMNFVDPGKSDGTPGEAEVYLQRSREIAANLFYLFNQVKKLAGV
jgi:arsenate reductase